MNFGLYVVIFQLVLALSWSAESVLAVGNNNSLSSKKSAVKKPPIQVNFNQKYPQEWEQLSIKDTFSLLSKKSNPTPQFIINWCNNLVRLLKDENTRNPYFVSRALTLLSYKAKENERIKTALQEYFPKKPELFTYWNSHTTYLLKSEKHRKKFNEKKLTNILYAHAVLGIRLDPTFLDAWKPVALSRLNLNKFNQQELTSIFYGHALLGLKLEDNFLQAWRAAVMDRINSENPQEQFNQQELANIFYGHALLGLELEEEFLQAWKRASFTYVASKEFKEHSDVKELHSIYLTMKRFSLEKDLDSKFQNFSLMKKVTKKSKPKSSKLQTSVSKFLASYLNQKVENEYWMESIASHVDIYIPVYNLIVEVDGPSHFFPGTKDYKPNNKLRDEIVLKDLSVTGIIRIPYFEWKKKKGEDRKTYIEEKFAPFLKAQKDKGASQKDDAEKTAESSNHPKTQATLKRDEAKKASESSSSSKVKAWGRALPTSSKKMNPDAPEFVPLCLR